MEGNLHRRKLLSLVATGPLALTGIGAASAENDQQELRGVGLSKDLRTSCFEQCDSLSKLCLIIADRCLEDLKTGRGDAKAIARLHRALLDCREFCSLVVTMALRESRFMTSACIACAEVCGRCTAIAEAANFESKEQVVEQLKECGSICRLMVQRP
jgi:hypothetical protein